LVGDLPVGVEGVGLDWDLGAVFGRITTSRPAGMEHEQRPEWDDDVLELLFVAHPSLGDDEMPIAPPGSLASAL
jgi:hypothetical protein